MTLICFSRLCVVLLTSKEQDKEHEKYRETLRRFIQKSPSLSPDRVRFTYVYQETQKDVILTLQKSSKELKLNDAGILKV